ncbi:MULTISPECIES: siderophore-interacting protein [Catenuloplanes]|uniref:NADPH-dependent ferric siderophore reductase n=1 Tax=Catenuloplanes niger TaxID=587534 RepID=A0AAE3ZLA0_9ACTN|nr:siderophore-interacting protein [Catenuloplanes niger]MDR7320766.1 NADPH-dependent ferric siderophore reductase [Catenuloplanes niger]
MITKSPKRGIADRILMLRHVTATEVERLRPRILRVRLSGPQITQVRPGQHIRVKVRGDGVVLRTYTVADINLRQQWLDLWIYQRSDESTPGLDWSRTVAPGDPVTFMGPSGRLVVQPDAPYHLVVGEETAQVAFAAILGATKPGADVRGVVEVSTPDERVDFPRADELTWTYRGDAPAAESAGLLEAVRALPLPSVPGVAYLAGEAKTIAAIRTHLVAERRWSRRSVLTKPFWTPGRKGLD